MMNQPNPKPPMLGVVADDVRYTLSSIPKEYRDNLRTMIRRVTAVAWQDGYLAGRNDASEDFNADVIRAMGGKSDG